MHFVVPTDIYHVYMQAILNQTSTGAPRLDQVPTFNTQSTVRHLEPYGPLVVICMLCEGRT